MALLGARGWFNVHREKVNRRLDMVYTDIRVDPVVKNADRFDRGPHMHAEGQLIYAIRGVVSVDSEDGTWVAPPNRAIWVPAGLLHSTRSYGPVQLRALFVSGAIGQTLPVKCLVVGVSQLLQALILRLASLPETERRTPFAHRLAVLLLDEWQFVSVQPLRLPLPRSRRLLEICRDFRAAPDRSLSIEAAAHALHTSRSTFMRRFRSETGLGFGQWCQQARLLAGLIQLAEGRSVLEAAARCGYDSPSAFTAAFRRSLATTPSRYFTEAPESTI